MSEEPAAPLREEVFDTPEAAARAAASHIAADLRAAAGKRGRCSAALSGGRTPDVMLRALAREQVPWEVLHLFQVDERDVPEGHPDRNWTHLSSDLLDLVTLRPEQLHPIRLGSGSDLDDEARRYARELEALAGRPPVLDLVHLGLGRDGHTASLTAGDPVLDVRDAPVAATRAYRGRRRITLTYRTLDAARRLLRIGDRGLPAGRVARERALLVCDAAAAGGDC
jgi:6-phosphogluconolactonase